MPTKPRRLTGTRIRERRLAQGLKQAAVARKAGISASYLNLIEHNRRPIGGKVLVRLADALQVEPQSLSEGADLQLLDTLRRVGPPGGTGKSIAGEATGDRAEVDRVEEFVGRFPGWAERLSAQARDIEALQEQLQRQNDQLSHDPVLSDRMHDMLAAVAAIRSTASILVDTPEIDARHRARFHANMDTESRRLAESSGAMAQHFEHLTRDGAGALAPLDAVSAFFEARGYHLAQIEADGADGVDALLDNAPEFQSGAPQSAGVRELVAEAVTRYADDARALPMPRFLPAAHACGHDPAALAQQFGAPLAQVFRRLAVLPRGPNALGALGGADAEFGSEFGPEFGLVTCDAAGALLFRKPCTGFAVPRFGAACALWPLFAALRQPQMPLHTKIEAVGGAVFDAYAISTPVGAARFDAVPVMQASMLVVACDTGAEAGGAGKAGADLLEVGTSCRLCPRAGCAARREPSSVTR